MKSEVGYLLLFVSFFNSGLCHHSDELDIFGEGSSRQPPVTVLEVRRKAIGGRIKLTVKYQANEATWQPLWEHAWENIEGTTTTEVDDDVYETSIMLDGYELAQERYRDNENFYYHSYALAEVNLYTVQDGAFRSNQVLTLSIRYDEGDYVERDIPSLLLEVDPTSTNFFYNEGQDLTFEVKMKPRPSQWHAENFELTTYLLDPDTGKVVFNDNDELFEVVNTETFPDFERRTIKIETSETRPSGILGLTASYTANFAPALLEEMKRTKEVTLSPLTTVRPFPDGYLGFVESFGPESRLRAGQIELLCRLGVPCLLECQAVGANIVSVTMRRLKADGTTEPLDDVSDMAVISPVYMRAKRARVLMDATVGRTQTIQCVAENAEDAVETMEATWDPTSLEAGRPQYFWPNL